MNTGFLSYFAQKKLLQIVFEFKKIHQKIIVLLLAIYRAKESE